MPNIRNQPEVAEQPHRKVKFDPTVNLGHLLTFLGFLSTGAIAYFDLRERITVTEVRAAYIQHEMQEEKDRVKDSLVQIKSGIADINRKVDDMRERQFSQTSKRSQ